MASRSPCWQASGMPRGLQPSFDMPGDEQPGTTGPLAARMRPRTLEEYTGQDKAFGEGAPLRRALESGYLPSIILWGPPGCGKTTLAHLLAERVDARFVALSAVTAGVADLRQVVATAKTDRARGRRTVLFVDEIHRFNKAQQDVILPHVEDGTVILIGATTENPSFEVVAPLLSRTRVVRLGQLDEAALATILRRALSDTERGLGDTGLTATADAIEACAGVSSGDARAALNILELAARLAVADGAAEMTAAHVSQAAHDRSAYHDRAGDAHFDTVSAFIKSMRGSDPDASLYWMARMLQAGEDPLFIVRRMVILAAEDVGLADPQALQLAVACQQAVHFLGLPEGEIPMAECVTYLALAPKSNSAYAALGRAREAAADTPGLPVPLHLRNAPTRLSREMGHGAGYRYAHDEASHVAAGQHYLPDALDVPPFFEGGELGAERELVARWRAAQAQARLSQEAR